MLLDIESHEPRCNVGRVTVIRYFVRKRCIREALGVQDLTTVGSVRRSPTYGLRGG